MPAMTPQITLIKQSGPNPIMSKRIFLDEQGKVCSDGSQCLMAQGIATRATAETAADLARHILACGSDQAIALGTLRGDLRDSVTITIPEKLKDNPGAITRSLELHRLSRGGAGLGADRLRHKAQVARRHAAHSSARSRRSSPGWLIASHERARLRPSRRDDVAVPPVAFTSIIKDMKALPHNA